MAFFASVFALAVTPDTTTATKIMTTLLCGLMTFGWFSLVAVALSTPRIRARYQRARKAIDRVAGSILMLFGAKLAFSKT
jgi:threonine/homoserine/homoserine lactone efflux protein